MAEENRDPGLGPTWGMRLIKSLQMLGYEYDLLTEADLKAVKSFSEKAASSYEILLGNYCIQKTRADNFESKIGRLTQENAQLKGKIDSLTDEIVLLGGIVRDLENWDDDDESEKNEVMK